ncbi:MAG TPA: hypothetical protein VGK73_26730 [Polyangiaceae bacterium]
MKLSDVMSAMNLSIYAEVALLLFIGVFVGVLVEVFSSGRRYDAMRLLPLEDDALRAVRPDRGERP